MPSRRRPRDPRSSSSPAARPDAPASGGPSTERQSDLERFAAGLKETDRRQREQRKAAEQRAADTRAAAQHKADAAAALAGARRELDAAIAAVRTARGPAAAAADAAWRAAKAKVIELETGTAPAWAPKPVEHTPGDGETDDAGVVADDDAADTSGDAAVGGDSGAADG